ncbi:MAG TPA: glycoside hydrolase family 3 N-terminal domain-containing protein, partial [Calditrichia bacterium]|nr:glycoside hydrolase family 3 N-terminal domain-containing protein [Calditrichia bacterium]
MSEKSHHAETLHTSKTAPYRNPELAPEERARDLLGNMTLAEKVAQMMGTWQELNALLFDDKGETDLERIRPLLKNGIGQIGRLSSFNGGLGAEEMAQWANTLQKFIIENTRLGIPAILHEECLHGLAARDATSYPQPIGLASTFNPELVEQIYTAIARDTRARGAHQALTPVVDVAREPRWGRVEETFGEDPYLVSRLGIAAVRGFQGDNTFCNGERVLATLKHYAAHGEPESGTNCAPVNVSERLLRDTFLYTFREVIRHAAPRSVMASYNEIDGVPSHASKWLLRTVLREEWGFTGFVVSDYYAVTELNHKAETVSHAVARDKTEAAALAASAGVNIELPEVDCYPNLISLVEDGLLAEAVIDEMVMPMLLDKFRLGLFENPYVDPKAIDNEAKLRDDRSIARQAARETAVLLKNEGNLLPLRIEDYRTVAVIGPNADRVLLGGYSGKPRYYTSVLEGIRARIGQQAEVLYSEGCRITEGGSWNEDEVHFPDPAEDRQRLENALKVAQKADLIILAIGGNEQTSREAWGKVHLGDRPSLELVGLQNELAEALLATGKPLVTLLFNGRPKSITAL